MGCSAPRPAGTHGLPGAPNRGRTAGPVQGPVLWASVQGRPGREGLKGTAARTLRERGLVGPGAACGPALQHGGLCGSRRGAPAPLSPGPKVGVVERPRPPACTSQAHPTRLPAPSPAGRSRCPTGLRPAPGRSEPLRVRGEAPRGPHESHVGLRADPGPPGQTQAPRAGALRLVGEEPDRGAPWGQAGPEAHGLGRTGLPAGCSPALSLPRPQPVSEARAAPC